MVRWLGPDDPFPPLETALSEPNGLLAIGRTLAVPTLLEAYSQGIFPWFSRGEPILWWSPDPRMILAPAELHVSRSLAQRLRRGGFEMTADRAFESVMRACAAPRPGDAGTWISERMIRAYRQLHEAGFAHSIETWMDGELAGGLYGVAIGRAFFGESMFSDQADASKIAFVSLVSALASWQFSLIDCQVYTEHLARFGAQMWSRRDFLAALEVALDAPTRRGKWVNPAGPPSSPGAAG